MRQSLRIQSGGQSGVDRASLDAAKALGLPYAGWCPRGGWAEDFPAPPGMLALYPELTETPSDDPRQRTAWNVRDSDATLIVTPHHSLDGSPGTAFTRLCAELVFVKPLHVAELDQRPSDVVDWLRRQSRERAGDEFVLNVAGPRESESPGVYQRAVAYLTRVLGSSLGDIEIEPTSM